MNILAKFVSPVFVLALLAMSPEAAMAQGKGGGNGGGGGGGGGKPGGPGDGGDSGLQTYEWMHTDVALAFDPDSLGGSFTGAGSHMVILDNHSGGSRIRGNLDGKTRRLYHGQWTSMQAQLVAPGASFSDVSYSASGVVSDHYAGSGLNVVNMSFGLLDHAGQDENAPLGTPQWDSIITEANNGSAVFVKSSGNVGGIGVGDAWSQFIPELGGQVVVQDYLGIQLLDAPGALFVGALEQNGDDGGPASMASYSTLAGDRAYDQFVVVGVETNLTSLAGTSFAAPIVTGYAAILGEKFNTATPELIVDQLLDTARKDTLAGFGVGADCAFADASGCVYSYTYGAGEASLANALSPGSIPN